MAARPDSGTRSPIGRAARALLVIAPLCWLAGWLVLVCAGHRPGPGWTTGHLLRGCALALLTAAAVTLSRMIRADGRRGVRGALRLGTVSIGFP